MSELSVHAALLIVNIPKITKTRLSIIHKGGTMLSPLFDNCSPFKRARKAKITKAVTDNKPDSHLGKRLVRKYPIPVMNIPRYIEDQAVHPIASPIESDSALNPARVSSLYALVKQAT
jgi:hypothetical protein